MNKNFKELDEYYNNLVDSSESRYQLLNIVREYFFYKNGYKNICNQLICAEIGVFRGEFSKKIYEYLQPYHHYLIDIWHNYKDCSQLCKESNEYFNYVYNDVCNIFSNKDLYTIMKMESKIASQKFTDNTFDFIYIDANHDDCFNDLTYWFPKLKKGGIIAGHDYYGKVKTDVIAFFNNLNINSLFICKSNIPQWYYIK